MKKVFVISAVLLIVVLIFLGIYNFAFKKESISNQEEVPEPVVSTVKNNALPVKPEKIITISDGSIFGPIMNKKTEEIKYFDASTGLIWEMDGYGKNKRQITENKIVGLKNVLWSSDHSKALLIIEKDGRKTFQLYDYQTHKAITLKDGLDTVVWDNFGTKIFYKYFDAASKERTLNIANQDGSGWQKISDIAIKNLVIAPVPLTATVSYWNHPSAQEESLLQVVSAAGGEVKTILNGKYGADYLWSPKGDKALVSALMEKGSKNIALGYVDLNGKHQDLGIPTLASKCAWAEDGKTFYYALPGEIPSNAIMPDDYQENKFSTSDTFWKMNITTGEKSRIIETTDIKSKFDSSNLFLSATEDALFFVNKIDKKLYRIKL